MPDRDWGGSLEQVAGDLKAGGRQTLDDTLASAKAGGQAVVRFYDATASAVKTGAGEMVNLGTGLAKVGAAKSFGPYVRAAKKLFSSVDQECSPSDTPAQSTIRRCPTKPDIFSGGYRDSLIGSQLKGADQPQLRAAMVGLSNNPSPPDVERNLAIIARERGRKLEDIKAEYAKYLEYSAKADMIRKAEHLEPIDKLLPNQADFMASN